MQLCDVDIDQCMLLFLAVKQIHKLQTLRIIIITFGFGENYADLAYHTNFSSTFDQLLECNTMEN